MINDIIQYQYSWAIFLPHLIKYSCGWNCVPPKICWGSYPQYLWTWPSLEIGPTVSQYISVAFSQLGVPCVDSPGRPPRFCHCPHSDQTEGPSREQKRPGLGGSVCTVKLFSATSLHALKKISLSPWSTRENLFIYNLKIHLSEHSHISIHPTPLKDSKWKRPTANTPIPSVPILYALYVMWNPLSYPANEGVRVNPYITYYQT